uniref:Type III-B CRISPR module-associated protein Cmr3 n=1 Tax=Schlesneria paludicola TaxID=360056 RepID=A0A7C4QMU6_9PLAN
MSTILELTTHDPLIARDGRPFGIGQGNRMRGLPWPLPSVVAGAFRTALVTCHGKLDFSGDMPQKLLRQVSVHGVFPTVGHELYLPAPNDAVAEPVDDNKEKIPQLHRLRPQEVIGGCDFPRDGLLPVMLSESQAKEDFKPAEVPAWWPVGKYAEWLVGKSIHFDSSFLSSPRQSTRDHVQLDANRGAAAESRLYATANLHLTHLPRFGAKESPSFPDRFADIRLSVRVQVDGEDLRQTAISFWHPLGGERRLVHWQPCSHTVIGWDCPQTIRDALAQATRVRMVLATPAIFSGGWRPGWLDGQLEGTPPGSSVKLKLVGVANGRWKAVSGWSLAPPRGPKPIRRMVPAGSVYFFTCEHGAAAALTDLWLKPVSDDEQAQRDGFGLAVWGTW